MRILSTLRDAFKKVFHQQPMPVKPGSEYQAVKEANQAALREPPVYDLPRGHKMRSRLAGKTPCRCTDFSEMTAICKPNTHIMVFCKRHRLYCCRTCGKRDRDSGRVA